jgi:glycosyltransferase involved in cell wall biosynthesis
MKISFLISNLSSNVLMRAYPAAKILARHYEVELIGPAFSGGVYEPYREEFAYKCECFNDAWWQTRWKRRFCTVHRSIAGPYHQIAGDVVYAFKPRLASFGTGLIRKCLRKCPLVLDIDDWEADEYYSASWLRKCKKLTELGDPQNLWYARWIEPLVHFADEKTVNSGFLQNRFGGVKVPSAVDCDVFNPDLYDRDKLRKAWHVENKKVVLFTGQVTPHKGLAEICQALDRIGSDDIKLMIVGPDNDYLRRVMSTYPEHAVYLGAKPHRLMPEFLSLADLVVLAQQKTPYAEAQVPGKLFEAMAMAKPIVATALSDLPEILNGCGWLIDSPDAESLAKVIQQVLDSPETSLALGQKARQKCIRHYSWDSVETPLLSVFERYG